jgi:N-acetyl-anhydromuramyl-L-alanine amidase AmpD
VIYLNPRRKGFTMHLLRKLSAAVSASMLLVACSDQDMGSATSDATNDVESNALSGEADLPRSSLDQMFQEASDEFDVPVSLLKAIGFVETRWQMVRGEEEFEGMPAAHGVMALRGERLLRGARLARASADEVKSDALSNIRAAAALLSESADEQGIDRADLGAWAPIIAEQSGIEQPEAQASYVHKEVYRVLREGVVVETEAGLVGALAPQSAVEPAFKASGDPQQAAGPDYAPAVWRPSPNWNARPTTSMGDPAMVIIHSCEGSYSSCWSWLTNTAAQASAHYVVNESGSEISQLVDESNRAWHIAAAYSCSLNSSVDCFRNGVSSNHFTIGIEHGGFASQASWPLGQIDASAKLVCDITRDNAIPRDKFHIVSHGQLQPANRTDPGPNWPWTDYINRIKNHCGDGGGSAGTIIDSNNSNNDTNNFYVQVSANWSSSTNVAGYYGTGYFWANTEAVSDGAAFFFFLPAAATKTVSAWWTAGTDRSTTAPFVMFNASGTNLGTVNVNQQASGGQWNTLGTFNFSAGWNKVVLSRWTATGSVVVADAIRIQ